MISNFLQILLTRVSLLVLLMVLNIRAVSQLQVISFDCHPLDSCDCFCCSVMLDSADIGQRFFEYRGDSVIVHLDEQDFVLSGDSVIFTTVRREILIGFKQESVNSATYLETSFLDDLTTEVAEGFPPLYGRHGEKVEIRFIEQVEEIRLRENDILTDHLSINFLTGNSDQGNGISSSFMTETANNNLVTHAPPSYIHYVSILYDLNKGPVSGLLYGWESCLGSTISDVFDLRSWISSPCR